MFNQYPYINENDLNLDYILKSIKKLKEIVDEFVTLNTITFADPITWNISTQYARNTVVIDVSGNAYLSKVAVPAGVQLNNSDYWLEIFNFTEYTRTANQNLTVNVENNTTRATAAYAVDDWLLWNDVLYKVIVTIAIDDTFITSPDAEANIEHFTVEDFIKAFITYATNLINQYKNDIDASELEYRQQLAGDIASTTASLQAQLNIAISGATVDSEVINARLGADGVTYATLGEAIRTQFTNLESALNKNNDATFFHNLFNKTDIYEGMERDSNTGELINSTPTVATSGIIPVESGKTIYVTANGAPYAPYFIYLYNKDGQYTQRVNGASSFVITSTMGAISICFVKANATTLQIAYSPDLPYEPYGEIPRPAYNKSVANEANISILEVAESKNENDIKSLYNNSYFVNLFDETEFLPNKEITATGELIDNSLGYGVTDYVLIPSGKTVYFSYDGTPDSAAYRYMYDADKTWISRLNTANSYTNNTANDMYIRLCILNTKATKYQIQYDEVSAWEPYGNIGQVAYERTKLIDVINGMPDPTNPLAIIKETPGYLECFLQVGCIGDSLASGLCSATENYPDNPSLAYLTLYQFSWGQFLARKTGNTYYNFSKGGLNTRTWLISEYATQCYDGNHKCTAYIIGLGQNDYIDNIPIGTISDIIDADYTQNPDTFYGNYGKIIQRIKAMFPLTKPKIFICTDPLEAVEVAGYNTAIRTIAEHFANVWLIDLYTYAKDIINGEPFETWKRNSHYNAPAYLFCSWIIQTYIDWIIRTNPGNFKNIELIGTEYTGTAVERE